ncbi:MAG: hypothetical protein Q7S88_02925 [Candidatus Daviesbacteria bacterium]|nr:hypothetical protein [Candidatus Daviesbacteria bacterium]
MSDTTAEKGSPPTVEWKKIDPAELIKIVAYTIREGPYQTLQTVPGMSELANDPNASPEDRERFSKQVDTNSRQGLEDLQALISILLENSTKNPELPIDNKYTDTPIINLGAWRQRKKLLQFS